MPRLLILQDYLRHGGTESHAVWLATAMRARGVEASILTCRPGGPLAARARDAGVPLRALQPFDCRIDGFAPRRVAVVREMRPDAVLLMGKVANAGALSLAGAMPGLRVVGSVRTGHPLPWYVRRALPACDAVVCNARTIAASPGLAGVAPSRITVIPNPPVLPVAAPDAGVREAVRARYGAGADAVVLLCVAGFRAGKGQEALIRTLALMPPELRSRAQLWLAGDGETAADCRALAASTGLSDRIRFLGHCADPRPLYLAADLAVMASAAEALPNFLVEAQLHGLPVAAWDVGGVAETFEPGVTGLSVPAGDMAALACAWSRYLTDGARRVAEGAAARRWAAATFSESAALDAYGRVFGF